LVGWLWIAPSPAVCRVSVAGMPVPQLRYHELRVSGRALRAAALVEVPEGTRRVVLVGPRYFGEVELPRVCSETLVLRAKPLPARLELQGLPPRAVVSCRDCPGIEADANFLPWNLPPMVMRELRTSVSLWVRAPGFQSMEFTVLVYPGENVVSVPMRARSVVR
jgi:hypothetical protein